MTLALGKVNGSYNFRVSTPFLAIICDVKQRSMWFAVVRHLFSVPRPQFHMVVGLLAEGLYSLKFHYCQNRLPGLKFPYSFAVSWVCWC